MKNLDVFGIFLLVRLLSVFLVQTFFVPDEYWQSLEVAHRAAFGYGYLTWEWTWGIRSYFYPLIFTIFYNFLDFFSWDIPEALIYGPRILQAILSAYSDLCLYQWSGSRKWAVFNIASSWFWFYIGSRTLINTFETCLTTIALSQFPWLNKGKEGSNSFIWLVALVCVIRPTATIIWAPICLYHLTITQERPIALILTRYIPIGLIVLTLSIVLDSLAYGEFTISAYQFIKFNVMEDVGSFYGTHPWFWYLSAGFPAVIGIQFIPFLIASLVVLKNRFNHPNELALLGTVFFTLAMYSCFPHKEFRFITPLLPIVLYISSRFLSAWSHKANKLMLWMVAVIIFIGNLGPAWYLSIVHQRGTLDVMGPLREIAWKSPHNTSFLFLMPCHSTPYYSYLHINVTSRFLTCEPNFNKSENYICESDEFYNEPMMWLRQHFPSNGSLPSHIICFDTLKPKISNMLTRYKTTHEFFHATLPSPRMGHYILINERIDL